MTTRNFKEDMILESGYLVETHEVITDDGYFLKVHRIPPATKNKTKVIFLMHGLACTAIDYLRNGKNDALGIEFEREVKLLSYNFPNNNNTIKYIFFL